MTSMTTTETRQVIRMSSFKKADGPQAPDPGGRPRHSPPGARRQEMQAPKQTNLQFVDDTWERLLNALERLEQVTEDFQVLSATRLDRHADRGRVTEDEAGVRTEVHLQIRCLQRVLFPVREEGRWMLGDFLVWYAARAGREPAAADEYAAPIVQCIIGESYALPPLEYKQPTEQDILQATEALAGGLQAADRVEERFRKDPEAVADRHTHARAADPAAGLARLAGFDRVLAARIAEDRRRDSSPRN
jgi:hypothetical protein